jgi:hypothetical protein
MLLCEEGRARIDDPIGKYLPDLHPVTHAVTMRQLMGNISGLRDVHGIRWQFSGMERTISSADLLSLYREIDDVNFAPATALSYNNGGFLMVSAVIERIAGRSLEEFFRERIFERIGMRDTLLRRFDHDFVPNSATMHMTTEAGGFNRSYLAGPFAGEGGIVSTVNDMLRWLAHMDAPVVGTEQTWKLMRSSQTLLNGMPTGYGLGLMIDRYRGVETLYHAGGAWGANAQMLKVPAAGLDVIVLVNRHDVIGMSLADEILDACLPSLEPRERRELQRPPAIGLFRSSKSGRVIQLRGGGIGRQQQIVAIDGAEMVMERDSEVTLSPVGPAAYMKKRVTLIGDPQAPRRLQLEDFGSADELVAVEPLVRTGVQAIAGRYRSASTGTDATVCATEKGPQLHTAGRFGTMAYDIECLAEGIWRGKWANTSVWSALLSFDSDARAFRFSMSGTSMLPFRRCD